METAEVPSIEWVKGDTGWRAIRWGVPFGLIGGAGVTIAVEIVLHLSNPSASLPRNLIFLEVGLLVAGLVVSRALSFLPAVRLLGISQRGLILDLGLGQVSYAWDEITAVKRDPRPPGNKTPFDRSGWAKVYVKGYWGSPHYVLSARQAERLSQFPRPG